MPKGIFTISLDFELYWGVRDHRTLKDYGEQIRQVHSIVPRLLDLFEKYQVHCTWATVGFLFSENKSELENNLPLSFPEYENPRYDPYPYMHNSDLEKEYHFAPELVDLINSTPGQEVATHTYSHFYALEKNTTTDQFRNDLKMAIEAATKRNIQISSIVFPRNQYGDTHISICRELGITAYRGNVNSSAYSPTSRENDSIFRRGIRFLDSFMNMTGNQCYSYPEKKDIINVPASRFLRPYSKKLKWMEPLKYKRIKTCMEFAANNGRVYHLWWHPHNFGSHTNENFRFLESILKIFERLRQEGKMESQNLKEIYEQTREGSE